MFTEGRQGFRRCTIRCSGRIHSNAAISKAMSTPSYYSAGSDCVTLRALSHWKFGGSTRFWVRGRAIDRRVPVMEEGKENGKKKDQCYYSCGHAHSRALLRDTGALSARWLQASSRQRKDSTSSDSIRFFATFYSKTGPLSCTSSPKFTYGNY